MFGYTWTYMFVCVFFKSVVWVSECGEYSVKTSLTSCNPFSCPLCPVSCSPTPSLCYLNNIWVWDVCQPAKSFHCILHHFSKTKEVLLGPCFQCLHQLFQSDSHLSQLMVPPVPSHRKWGIPITRGGYEKGHLFRCCRWQNGRRNSRGQAKF